MRCCSVFVATVLAVTAAAPAAALRLARTLPRGVIDVTEAPWLADPTGAADATAALQGALDHGARTGATVFLPAGRFRVTDTLNCSVDWPFLALTPNHSDPGPPTPDWLFASHVVVGERPPRGYRPGDRRPTTLFVPPNTPRFADQGAVRFAVHLFHTAEFGAKGETPNININQILSSVDIEIGAGNSGAGGVMHIGAQGSGLEDVTVWAGPDASVGIFGAAGGGGAHHNVRVVGGRFGLDLRAGQPAPTVSSATLVNQSCSALVYVGRGPLTLVGAVIEQLAPPLAESAGTVVAGMPPSVFRGRCSLPALADPFWAPLNTFSGSLSVVDTTIEQRAPSGAPPSSAAVTSNRTVFARGLYVKGYDAVIAVGPQRLPCAAGSSGWSAVTEAVVSTSPPPFEDRASGHTYRFASPVYVGGARRSGPRRPWAAAPVSHVRAPPSDLASRHGWDEATFPTFQTGGAADAVHDCGAAGDGVADDRPALQRCVDENDVVVLPKGFYRLGGTLTLRRSGGALVGVGRTASVLVAAPAGIGGDPLVRVTGSGTVVHQLELVTWWHVPGTWLLDWAAPSGVWRQAHGIRTCDVISHPRPRVGPSCANYSARAQAVALDRPLTVVSGGVSMYTFYIEDWHFQGPRYRDLLVNGSTAGVRVYQVNTDCARGEAAVEVASSSGVELFGMKSEGNYLQVWVRNSSGVLLTGYGGYAEAFPLNTSYPAGFAQYPPSLLRVEHSSNVTLANVWGDCRVGMVSPFGGTMYDPRLWSFLVWSNGSGPAAAGIEVLPPLVRPSLFKL